MIPTRGRGILDVPGLALGHAGTLTRDRLTGVSVVIPPTGSTIGVDVRGGGPATHETDVVSPTAHGYGADAIVLTGGSALGLRSVSGVCDALAEVGRGFPAPGLDDAVVPLVPAAAIYDLGRGSGEVAPPTIAEGAEAARAALTGVGTGDQGAGTAGRAGTASDQGVSTDVRGSIGVGLGARAGMQTLAQFARFGVRAGAGRVHGRRACRGQPVRDDRHRPGRSLGRSPPRRGGMGPAPAPALPAPDPLAAASARNTTLAIVATDARLDTAQVSCLAFGGHPGIARAVRPSHTLFDGDTVFAIATGEVPPPRTGARPRPTSSPSPRRPPTRSLWRSSTRWSAPPRSRRRGASRRH
ncbi:P1 family peptidase [Brevibacterium casei]|nr:P1 family peptidase [Brevibacterium casei]